MPHVNIKQFKWEKKINKINETKKLNWLNKQAERETFRGAFFSVLHMLSCAQQQLYIHTQCKYAAAPANQCRREHGKEIKTKWSN